MADEKKAGERSLEMRVAEIEDKLAKLNITEDELKAYQKVASLMGGGAALEGQLDQAASAAAICTICIVPRQRFINRGIITPRINRGFCVECVCGPCNCDIGGTGGGFGGGFGGFGM